MISGSPRTYTQDLELLYQAGAIGGLTDRELLGHFLAGDRAWAQRAVGEGVTSCPRAGCGKSARPVR